MDLSNITRESLPELLPGMALGITGAEQNAHSDLMAHLITKLQEDNDYQLTLGEYEGLKTIPPDDYCFMLAEILLKIVGSEELDNQSAIAILDQLAQRFGTGTDGFAKSISGLKDLFVRMDKVESSTPNIGELFPVMYNHILQISALTGSVTEEQVNDPIWYQMWKCQSFVMGIFIEGFSNIGEKTEISEWDMTMLQTVGEFRQYLEPFQVTTLDALLEEYKDWTSKKTESGQ